MDQEFINQVIMKAKLLLASAGISASLLTGNSVNNNNFVNQKVQIVNMDYNNIDDDQIIFIPVDCKESVINALVNVDKSYANKTVNSDIRFGDLKKLNDSLLININNSENLSFLNYCINVKYLIISFNEFANLADLKYVNKMPNLETLVVTNNAKYGSNYIDKGTGRFLSKSENLRVLFVTACGIDPSIVNNLTSLEELSINSYCHPENIDFNNLNKLSHLFLNDGLYDAAIYFDDKMINTLKKNNISYELCDNDNHSINDLLDINKQLNIICDKLPINENSTDHEKLNAILYYVLNNYNYDPEVAEEDKNNEPTDFDKFYHDGLLYGALTRKNIICGNYSAIMQALLIRAGVNSHVLISSEHAWNMVYVNGSYYYVDATWLDNEEKVEQHLDIEPNKNGFPINFKIKSTEENAATALKNGNIYDDYNFPSYMMDPNGKLDKYHKCVDIPSSEALKMDEPSKYSSIEDITNKYYRIRFNGKTHDIAGGVMVGIFVVFGIAKSIGIVEKKKEKEKQNKKL